MVMVVEGHGITDAMIARVEMRMRQGPFTSGQLGGFAVPLLAEEFGRPAGVMCAPAHRLADRLVQKHRKAGNITKSAVGRPVWTWTESAA